MDGDAKRRRTKERRKGRAAARSSSIEHWLIREAFLPFITPRLINRGQVNSVICHFNDISSYEINVADLDDLGGAQLPLQRTSFNPARVLSIIFHFYTVVRYLAGIFSEREKEKRASDKTNGKIYYFFAFFLLRRFQENWSNLYMMNLSIIKCNIIYKKSFINHLLIDNKKASTR